MKPLDAYYSPKAFALLENGLVLGVRYFPDTGWVLSEIENSDRVISVLRSEPTRDLSRLRPRFIRHENGSCIVLWDDGNGTRCDLTTGESTAILGWRVISVGSPAQEA